MDLICLSHSPLLRHVEPRDERGRHFLQKVETARRSVSARQPEVIVAFAPDHFNGFLWNVMPPFCIGFSAEATRDWEIPAGTLNVPRQVAQGLAQAIRE